VTWTSFHRRADVLRRVVDVANARRDGHLPLEVEGVAEAFDDPLDLLSALQLRWHTRLAGGIDRELAAEPVDLEAAVVAAWHRAADGLPGVRAVLDAHRAAPVDDAMREAIAKAVAKERILLAVMSGRAAVADALAAAVGARVEERARATYRPANPPAPAARTRLLDRIRAALAA
jgi:hypothetical protein